MIFSSKNENGEEAWKLVLAGKKTVTRRRSPQPVGKIRAVQARRYHHGIGKIKIVSCQLADAWFDAQNENYGDESAKGWNAFLDKESKKEGFSSWLKLWEEIGRLYPKEIPALYRIEFVLLKPTRDLEEDYEL